MVIKLANKSQNETMKVTRILHCETDSTSLKRLQEMAEQLTFLRSEIWRRFGALGTAGKTRTEINKEIRALPFYKAIEVAGNTKCEVVNDTVINILMYKEACKKKVKKEIWKRTRNAAERKRLFVLLKADKWLDDSFLHRRMRHYFKHGHSKMDNQVLLMSQNQSVSLVKGKAVIHLEFPKKFGGTIDLQTASNERLKPLINKKNLRLVLKNKTIEVHYTFDKPKGRSCGEGEIGIDKGYTEAFVDSDGEFYATDFGKLITVFSDKNKKTGQARNRLYALERKYREKGNHYKADKIRKFNVGQQKKTARKNRIQNQLKDRAYKAVHKMVDKAQLIISEDLTSPIKKKTNFKNMNRRLANWYKGILADAVNHVTSQRGAINAPVNCAYTSQMDSNTHRLEGKRVGDKFYHVNGDVSHAGVNASKNVRERFRDKAITLYMPYKEVRYLLLSRITDCHTTIQDSSCKTSLY
jgi:hypothetical protein